MLGDAGDGDEAFPSGPSNRAVLVIICLDTWRVVYNNQNMDSNETIDPVEIPPRAVCLEGVWSILPSPLRIRVDSLINAVDLGEAFEADVQV